MKENHDKIKGNERETIINIWVTGLIQILILGLKSLQIFIVEAETAGWGLCKNFMEIFLKEFFEFGKTTSMDRRHYCVNGKLTQLGKVADCDREKGALNLSWGTPFWLRWWEEYWSWTRRKILRRKLGRLLRRLHLELIEGWGMWFKVWRGRISRLKEWGLPKFGEYYEGKECCSIWEIKIVFCSEFSDFAKGRG